MQPESIAAAQGQEPLRREIARYVSHTRAVSCEAEDVVVTAGAQQAFDMLARVLLTPGRTAVAVEPGYPPLRAAFLAAGADLKFVSVDAQGLIVDLARAAVIIEDDYDGEFRFAAALKCVADIGPIRKSLADGHSGTLIQDTVAAMLAEGHLTRHVRKMQRVYAKRRDVLLRVLHESAHSGSHHFLLPPDNGCAAPCALSP